MIVQNIKSNIPNSDIFIDQSKIAYKKGRIAELHYHEEIELLFIISGTMNCKTNEDSYIANEGDIIFINSGIPHSTYSLEDGLLYGLLQFKENRLPDIENSRILKYSIKLKGLSEEPVKIFHSDEIFTEYRTILCETKEEKDAYTTMIKASVLKITGLLYRLGILKTNDEFYNTSSGKKILPALSFINQNYNDTITLEDVSGLLGFNESYFCRSFKRATGTTFTEYLNFVRVCKAEKLLSETSSSILDISTEVGFCSVSYFNRIFKRYKNCSPGYYRSLKYCKNI